MLSAGGSDSVGDVLDRFYGALQRRDLAELEATLAVAVVWEIPAPVADRGRLAGREAVMAWLGRAPEGRPKEQLPDGLLQAHAALQRRAGP